MITVATLLWDANGGSQPFSSMYDETWVTRLYHGFARNLSVPFRFVLFTEKQRDLPDVIVQHRMQNAQPGYGDCIEPYRLNEPMILVGLDTVIVGPINHLAAYCMSADKIALPRDPYRPEISCNGVALVPGGQRAVFDEWRGENDMAWLRERSTVFIDDIFPGQVVSYKGHIQQTMRSKVLSSRPASEGLGDARIVYFHGVPKMHQLTEQEWIRQHWLGEHG